MNAHALGARTDPDEAAAFTEATGVDAPAVAVGSSHAMTTRDAELDTDLIARLAAAIPVPLVLHGSSGVDDEQLRRAVEAGIRKLKRRDRTQRRLHRSDSRSVVRQSFRDGPTQISLGKT